MKFKVAMGLEDKHLYRVSSAEAGNSEVYRLQSLTSTEK